MGRNLNNLFKLKPTKIPPHNIFCDISFLNSNQLLFSENIKIEDEYFDKLNFPIYEESEKLKNHIVDKISKKENFSYLNKKEEELVETFKEIKNFNNFSKYEDISSIRFNSNNDWKFQEKEIQKLNNENKQKKEAEKCIDTKKKSTRQNLIHIENLVSNNININEDMKKSLHKIISKNSSSAEINKMTHINLKENNSLNKNQDISSKNLISIASKIDINKNNTKSEKITNNKISKYYETSKDLIKSKTINTEDFNKTDIFRNENIATNKAKIIFDLNSTKLENNLNKKKTKKSNIIQISLTNNIDNKYENKIRSHSSPSNFEKNKITKSSIEKQNIPLLGQSEVSEDEEIHYKKRKNSDFRISNSLAKDDNDLKTEDNLNHKLNLITDINGESIKEILRKFKYLILLENNGPYIFENLSELISTKLIYNSEFIMDGTNRIFHSESHVKSDQLLDKQNFKYVQVVLLKKENKHLGSLIKSLENFFDFYIKRKDERGNFMMKGALNNYSFLNMENYFNFTYKSLNVIDVVQISVFLFKYDVYFDYNPYYDKTNIAKDEINSLLRYYEMLKTLRENINEDQYKNLCFNKN